MAFSDTIDITLSEGAGTKTVYLKTYNDWTSSAVLHDTATLVLTGADPAR